MQHRNVQQSHTRLAESAPVDIAVESVIAEVVERQMALGRRHFHAAVFFHFGQERGGVIGHARVRRRQGRVLQACGRAICRAETVQAKAAAAADALHALFGVPVAILALSGDRVAVTVPRPSMR